MPPDQQFDDASEEEWAAYVLWYMRNNFNASNNGFDTKELSEKLGRTYEETRKYLTLLCSKKLIKSAHQFRNAIRYAPAECDFDQPELTERQQEIFDAMMRLAKSRTVKASYARIADEVGKESGQSSIPTIIETLSNKGYIKIIERSTSQRQGEYHMCPAEQT